MEHLIGPTEYYYAYGFSVHTCAQELNFPLNVEVPCRDFLDQESQGGSDVFYRSGEVDGDILRGDLGYLPPCKKFLKGVWDSDQFLCIFVMWFNMTSLGCRRGYDEAYFSINYPRTPFS